MKQIYDLFEIEFIAYRLAFNSSDSFPEFIISQDFSVCGVIVMEIQTCGKPIDSLLEKVLCMNILSSDYFKELYRLKTYHEVIDEIYNQVDHVEPWMTGNYRGPSTAFCLLYKFFTMKLTVKQMQGLLKHSDSPYIRAYYFDTLFPRIHVPVLRQVVSHLEKMKLPTKISDSTENNSRHGSDDTACRPPSIKLHFQSLLVSEPPIGHHRGTPLLCFSLYPHHLMKDPMVTMEDLPATVAAKAVIENILTWMGIGITKG
ncbi:Detected protein of confused Function [Hibiscus syriacus]|uniref:Pre-mRNA-splicing factor 38 n=1 Tax=Hibiscus syriacus TaxID=106335 RepID=A0A6A2Y3V8_HIBSY|nr:Detected protein of confused Function [Hibiscus syriacus]